MGTPHGKGGPRYSPDQNQSLEANTGPPSPSGVGRVPQSLVQVQVLRDHSAKGGSSL